MAMLDEKRLLAKIAKLYYDEKMKQTDIAKSLNLSQSFISRSLTKCIAEGIVQINVIPPPNIFLDLEQILQKRFALSQVIIVDSDEHDNEEQIQRAIGSAAAYYLQVTSQPNQLIGISAWSDTIRAMVDTMMPLNIKAKGVVQLLGGVGINGNVQANLSTYTLAQKLNCPAYLLPSQNISSTDEVSYKNELLKNPEVAQVIELFDTIDCAIIGIGRLEPSASLKKSGIYYNSCMKEKLKSKGAVGDICLHYFNNDGTPVLSNMEDPAIGIDLEKLKKCPKVIALAGGIEKAEAIKAALIGGYIDILVIDKLTAQLLLQ
ncbi:DNA-binding transcriptional regulator [Actinobacillus succinogenes]|uniref:Transcriptional regulator, DeoR family n=1 Tax=Actinobacillus succinogenes (strain ATCC 55618 / DSM 22257 / CCUG 43843 / 130Z) TaxID=339671 RepID=A6VKQ9_ACTSZ|nr:sugar-binding transcriptional regulator [Actinobacillus succinogenes]ABR73556.1 transcriptional regulator, DeoR family [Actinobacillus succinogenes 130Z]PHI39981.1 DNA-binding transcriptional regulator [Actinobacillus succinogenes]